MRSIAFLPALQQLVDVGLLDGVAAELDLDIGDVADELARAVARPHVLDRQSGHAFRELDRLANRELARGHVGDVAALHSAALTLAGAEHRQPPVIARPRDHRADLGRADIESGNQILFGGLRHFLGSPLLLRLLGHDRLARRARQADDHLAGNAQVEAHDPTAEQAGGFVEPGEFDEAPWLPPRLPEARRSRQTGS